MGTALGLADEDDGQLLSEIETRKGGNEGKCFMEVVNVWLRGSGVGPKTWGTLLHCLKETEMNEAVRSIQEKILYCRLIAELLVQIEMHKAVRSIHENVLQCKLP